MSSNIMILFKCWKKHKKAEVDIWFSNKQFSWTVIHIHCLITANTLAITCRCILLLIKAKCWCLSETHILRASKKVNHQKNHLNVFGGIQPIWKILVKLDHFPRDRDEQTNNYFKPPPIGIIEMGMEIGCMKASYALDRRNMLTFQDLHYPGKSPALPRSSVCPIPSETCCRSQYWARSCPNNPHTEKCSKRSPNIWGFFLNLLIFIMVFCNKSVCCINNPCIPC